MRVNSQKSVSSLKKGFTHILGAARGCRGRGCPVLPRLSDPVADQRRDGHGPILYIDGASHFGRW
jgi:hypothetical protein